MLFTGHLTIFEIIFFSIMIQTVRLRKHIQIFVIKNSCCGSFYFWSYTTWKIGFVASPETSLKQVFRVKTS
jgi:hypothetical protein